MHTKDIKKKMTDLVNTLRYYDFMYYVRNTPVVSDDEYDLLREYLTELENQYPNLILPNSPSNYVGFSVDFSKKKHIHPVKMLSLKKAKDFKELNDFIEKYEKYGILGEIKIDGISLSLEYCNNILLGAYTRGNGVEGLDVTSQISAVMDIPLKIPDERPIIVRGEIYITKENAEKTEAKSFSYRNIAAGIINQKSMKQGHLLNFFAYSICSFHGEFLTLTQYDSLELLKSYGFPTCSFYSLVNAINVEKFITEGEIFIKKIELCADGIVLKINDLNIYNSLGSSMTSPLGAICYKFSTSQRITTIKNIEWQVGRTGVLTPVGIIEPILLSGTMVQKISLHNYKNIQQKKIGPGSQVVVKKSGDVIPYLEKVITENSCIIPNVCPSCHGELEITDSFLICGNYHCFARNLGKIKDFVEKLKLEKIGENSIITLMKEKNICNCIDFIRLKELPRTPSRSIFQKNWEKFLSSMEKLTLEQVIHSYPFSNINNKYIKLMAPALKDLCTMEERDINGQLCQLGIPRKTSENLAKDIYRNKDELSLIIKYFSG